MLLTVLYSTLLTILLAENIQLLMILTVRITYASNLKLGKEQIYKKNCDVLLLHATTLGNPNGIKKREGRARDV